MLNPQFVAGEHGLFGGHKSEDIPTFFFGGERSLLVFKGRSLFTNSAFVNHFTLGILVL